MPDEVLTPDPKPDPKLDSSDAREYNRKHRWLSVADTAIGFVMLLALLLTRGSAWLRDLSWKLAGDHYALALFFYVVMLALLAQLLGAPLQFYGFRLEHRFHLSNQTLKGWLGDELKDMLVGIVLGGIVAELVYLTIKGFPEWWWVIAWLCFTVLFVLLAQLAPVILLPLFYKFIPLEDEALKERLVRLSEKAGTRVRGVYEWKLSEKSKKANAALTGLGQTRRIILADTLLQNYSPDEIEAVLAHELGHHVHQHVPKSIAVQTVVSLLGFWLASLALNYAVDHTAAFSGLHDFANLPLLALVASGLALVLLPALNAYSRFHERQADLYCWKSVPSVTPFVTAMQKLTQQNLAEQNPSRIVEVLFHSHPAISKRIAAAEQYTRS
jgi:STE24 endopeptidase